MCQCSFKTGYCNYITAGRGIGMKFAFLFSFLTGIAVAILSGLVLRLQINTNDVDSFIDTLPVVKIQDGRIEEPILDNVVWTIPAVSPDDEDTYIIANTTVESVDTIPSSVFMYVTAKKIYIQSEGEVHAYDIPEMENTIITHDMIRNFVSLLLTIISVCIGVASLIIGLISFLISYLITLIFGSFFNRRMSISGWGRALVLPWSVLWIGTIVCSFSEYVTVPAYPLMWIIVLSAFITLFLASVLKKHLVAVAPAVENETEPVLADEEVMPVKEDTLIKEDSLKTKQPVIKVVERKKSLQTSVIQKRTVKSASAKKTQRNKQRSKSVKKSKTKQ